jgi:hypothetical protein
MTLQYFSGQVLGLRGSGLESADIAIIADAQAAAEAAAAAATATVAAVQPEIDALAAGKQDVNTNLTAISGLAPGANELIYWTGAGTADRTVFTPLARTILGRATSAEIRADIGLGSVSNTADADKPISTATAAALADKASVASVTAEAAARNAADVTEFNRATAAEATLSTAVTNEQTRALAQEGALGARQVRSETNLTALNGVIDRDAESDGIVMAVVDKATGRTAMDLTDDRVLRTGAAAFERSVGIGAEVLVEEGDDGAFGPIVVVDRNGRVVQASDKAGHILIRTIAGYVGDGVANDSGALAIARDRARTLGLRYVDLQGSQAYAPDLTSDGNVHFLNGIVSGRYGKRGAPPHRPAPFVGIGDLDAARHLPTFSAAAAPVVVLAGDSTSTIYTDTLQRRDSLSGILEDALRRAAIGKPLTFYNRGIGGQTWQTFNSGPGYTAPYETNALYSWWYTDPDQDWLDYIEALEPDLIVLHFGINDRQNIDWTAVDGALAKVQAWTKVPDIVLTTAIQPQSDEAPDYMTDVEQNGRDLAAGLMRTLAIHRDYGLLDFNRIYNLKVRGLDPVETSLVTAIIDQSATLPWQAAATYTVAGEVVRGDVRDYATTITISSLSASTFNTPLRFRLSGHVGSGQDNDLLVWRDASGKFAWNVRMAWSAMLFGADQISDVDCPTSGSVTLRFQLSHGGNVRLGIAGPYVETEIVNTYITRFGGVFRPAIAGSAAASATVSLWVGRELVYTPAYHSKEIWGDATLPLGTQQPGGGNGINHPTDLGSHLIYGPALAAARFV